MSPIKFKTVFIKMTRDPAKYAQHLEDALNHLQQEDWELLQFEHDMKKGTLLVARRVDPRLLPQHPLAVLLGAQPPSEPAFKGLSTESREVIGRVFHKMSSSPKGSEEDTLRHAAESVGRKYPNALLKKAVTELRAVVAHHREHAHESPDEKCDSSERYEKIASALEQQVAQSTV